MENKKMNILPSEFYRIRRPEYFSDSEIINITELPREVLEYELANITTNQKENEFETLCRRLAEKLITPNLIPQVGPTGGGDGKTDSETHPVSEFISDRWFVPENGWNKDEKWAFAISAKKVWRSKINDDVKEILKTDRIYTKIFFMTNQLPSSKKKKELQDKFKKELGIEIIILDGKWIVENIYNNDLIDLVVDSLNLTQSYKNKHIKIGCNDAQRLKELDEIESRINTSNRYFEYDYQLVEDALDAAILSRMLEKPKDEVEGKFNRAKRFCQKVNNIKQWIRLYYQKAWTYFNYYNDYALFIEEYKLFKEYVLKSPNISDVELYFNLFNLLKTLSKINNLSDYEVDIKKEKEDFLKLLYNFEIDKEKPCSSLIAKTNKVLLNISDDFNQGQVSSSNVNELATIINDCSRLLDYPFETIKEIIEEIGNYHNTVEFDELIDCVAKVSEKRNSEISAGKIFLKRGIQKLDSKCYKDSIIYFGKAVYKLSKEDTANEMFLTLIGLGFAYKELGLNWASNNCFCSATYISLKPWFESGKIVHRAINCVKQLAENELFIGRIPNFLSWYEMYSILSKYVDLSNDSEKIPVNTLFDCCLGTRLLNTDFHEVCKHEYLPDALDQIGLWMSRKCLLYLLGYQDLLITESKDDGVGKDEDLDELFKKWANQPFKGQMLLNTNFMDGDQVIFTSKILGCEILLTTRNNIDMILAAEMFLAFLESFNATSLKGVIPKLEIIKLNLIEKNDGKVLSFSNSDDAYNIYVNIQDIINNNLDDLGPSLNEFTCYFMINNFYIDEPFDHFKNLFEKEETHERLSFIFHHRTFITNILGNKPKFLLKNWIDNENFNKYSVQRIHAPSLIIDLNSNEDSIKTNFKNSDIRHDKRKLLSLIDDDLWNKAKWSGIGFIYGADGLGISLCFKNAEFGNVIFDNWIKKFGNDDKDEELKISFIRGINKNEPHWYRVQISSNLDKVNMKENELYIIKSRVHEMNPNNSNNLINIVEVYNKHKKFKLYPAKFTDYNTAPEVFWNKGIKKKELTIRYAWEINYNDPEGAAIKIDDEPFIPDDVTNAPVNEILNKLNGLK